MVWCYYKIISKKWKYNNENNSLLTRKKFDPITTKVNHQIVGGMVNFKCLYMVENRNGNKISTGRPIHRAICRSTSYKKSTLILLLPVEEALTRGVFCLRKMINTNKVQMLQMSSKQSEYL